MSVIYHVSHVDFQHMHILLSAIRAENRAAQEARIHAAQQRAENIMSQFNDCGSPPPNNFTPVTTAPHHVIGSVHPVLPLPSSAPDFHHPSPGHQVPDVSPAPQAQVTSPGNTPFSFMHMLQSNRCSGCMMKEQEIADLQEMLRLRESEISKLQEKLSSQGNITNLCPVKHFVTASKFVVTPLYWIKRKTKKCSTVDRHIVLTLINFVSAMASGTSRIADDKLGPLYERSTGTRITFTDHVSHLDIFWWIIGLCFLTHVWPFLEPLCVYSCSKYVSLVIFTLTSR